MMLYVQEDRMEDTVDDIQKSVEAFAEATLHQLESLPLQTGAKTEVMQTFQQTQTL